jgi:hypothetical protein
MKRAFDEFERIKTRMTRIYMHLLGIDRADCDKLLDRDTYMNAMAAKELGHIDTVMVNPWNKALSADDKARFDVELDILRDELTDDKMLLEIIAHRKATEEPVLKPDTPASAAPAIN